jgi:hypothetical protein
MKYLLIIIVSFFSKSLLGQLPLSDSTKALVSEIYGHLRQVSDDHKFTVQQIDSIKQNLCVVNLKETKILRERVSKAEMETMIKSKEPLLQILGFWFYLQTESNQKQIIKAFKEVVSNNSGSLDGAAPIYCGRYGFHLQNSSLVLAPYACFDMVTGQGDTWKVATRLESKYLRKAKRILSDYKEKADAQIVTVY